MTRAAVGVAGSTEAQGGRAGQGNGDVGADEATHLTVRPSPLQSKQSSRALAGSIGLNTMEAVCTEYQKGEVAAASQAGLEVLCLFLSLMSGEDGCGILAPCRRGVCVCDMNIKDAWASSFPETVYHHIPTCLRVRGVGRRCAGSILSRGVDGISEAWQTGVDCGFV